MGVQGQGAGLLSAELQLHATLAAEALSAALRFEDALKEIGAATTDLSASLEKLYPRSSSIEPARSM